MIILGLPLGSGSTPEITAIFINSIPLVGTSFGVLGSDEKKTKNLLMINNL